MRYRGRLGMLPALFGLTLSGRSSRAIEWRGSTSSGHCRSRWGNRSWTESGPFAPRFCAAGDRVEAGFRAAAAVGADRQQMPVGISASATPARPTEISPAEHDICGQSRRHFSNQYSPSEEY